ncbi:MAG TPA: hypothetical protein VKE40_10325 [Gemmataceae bacterium]|nr:hypothetical protein [Gemmataceae bacterium]
MRAIKCGLLTAAVVLAAGSAVADPPGRSEFDPGLRLKWPGTSSESSTVLPGDQVEIRTYSAIYTGKGPDGAVVYSAVVLEYPQAAVKDASPEELLAAYVFATRKHEVSRKSIEHGPAKLPGLDIVIRRDGRVTRRVVVAAGQRLYAVSVTAKGEALPDAAEVKEFIDSLAVGK